MNQAGATRNSKKTLKQTPKKLELKVSKTQNNGTSSAGSNETGAPKTSTRKQGNVLKSEKEKKEQNKEDIGMGEKEKGDSEENIKTRKVEEEDGDDAEEEAEDGDDAEEEEEEEESDDAEEEEDDDDGREEEKEGVSKNKVAEVVTGNKPLKKYTSNGVIKQQSPKKRGGAATPMAHATPASPDTITTNAVFVSSKTVQISQAEIKQAKKNKLQQIKHRRSEQKETIDLSGDKERKTPSLNTMYGLLILSTDKCIAELLTYPLVKEKYVRLVGNQTREYHMFDEKVVNFHVTPEQYDTLRCSCAIEELAALLKDLTLKGITQSKNLTLNEIIKSFGSLKLLDPIFRKLTTHSTNRRSGGKRLRSRTRSNEFGFGKLYLGNKRAKF